MNENTMLLLKKVEQDASLAEKFKSITNPDEAYALAASIQTGFTKEEFISAMEQLNNSELSKDDLAAIAGGDEISEFVVTTVVSSGMMASLGAV